MSKSRRTFIKNSAATAVLGCTYAAFAGTMPTSVFTNDDHEKFLKACADGNLDTVKNLLRKNPNWVSVTDQIGRSAFALALLAGHAHIADFLKESGHQPDLHESVLHLDWERFEELLGKESTGTMGQVNVGHPIGGTAMWAAAAGGSGTDIWRVYAKCGDPDLSPRKSKGTTPLQKALRYYDLPIAELTASTLISNNASPNAEPNADVSPLHIAAERGSFELVEMLIRLGANVGATDDDGRTAQQYAEKSRHAEVAELLANHRQIPRTCRTARLAYNALGEQYQAPDISGIPFYLRRRLVGQSHRNLDYVKEAVGADPRMAHCVATTSEICVEACAHMGQKPIVEFLLQNGAPYSLPTAVLLEDYSTVKKMLKEDPNRIHERGAHDNALLWYPVIGRCKLDMMQLLLDHGAQVEQQHYLGTTALHWAAMRGPVELLELLIENGADVNRVGRKFGGKSKTPLQGTRDEKIADYLKSKGAR